MDKKKTVLGIVMGGIIGAISGFFGGGGGMMVVPVLQGVYQFDQKHSHATAMLIILPISIFAGIVSCVIFKPQPLTLISVSLGVSVGGVIGAILLKKLNPLVVKYVFSALVFIASLKMIFGG